MKQVSRSLIFASFAALCFSACQGSCNGPNGPPNSGYIIFKDAKGEALLSLYPTDSTPTLHISAGDDLEWDKRKRDVNSVYIWGGDWDTPPNPEWEAMILPSEPSPTYTDLLYDLQQYMSTSEYDPSGLAYFESTLLPRYRDPASVKVADNLDSRDTLVTRGFINGAPGAPHEWPLWEGSYSPPTKKIDTVRIYNHGSCSAISRWDQLFDPVAAGFTKTVKDKALSTFGVGAVTRAVFGGIPKLSEMAPNDASSPWKTSDDGFLIYGYFGVSVVPVLSEIVNDQWASFWVDYQFFAEDGRPIVRMRDDGGQPQRVVDGTYQLANPIADGLGNSNSDGLPAILTAQLQAKLSFPGVVGAFGFTCNPTSKTVEKTCRDTIANAIDPLLASQGLTSTERQDALDEFQPSNFECKIPTDPDVAQTFKNSPICHIIPAVERVNVFPDYFEFVFNRARKVGVPSMVQTLAKFSDTAKTYCSNTRTSFGLDLWVDRTRYLEAKGYPSAHFE